MQGFIFFFYSVSHSSKLGLNALLTLGIRTSWPNAVILGYLLPREAKKGGKEIRKGEKERERGKKESNLGKKRRSSHVQFV